MSSSVPASSSSTVQFEISVNRFASTHPGKQTGLLIIKDDRYTRNKGSGSFDWYSEFAGLIPEYFMASITPFNSQFKSLNLQKKTFLSIKAKSTDFCFELHI